MGTNDPRHLRLTSLCLILGVALSLGAGCARRRATRTAATVTPAPAPAQPAAAPVNATSPESTAWIQGLTRVPRERILPIHPNDLTYSEMIANASTWSGSILMLQVRSESFASQIVDEGDMVYYLHVLPVTRGNPNVRPIAFRFSDTTWLTPRVNGQVDLRCQPGNCPQTTLVARMTGETVDRVIDEAGTVAPLPVLEVLGVADRVDFWESAEMTQEFPSGA